MAAAAPPRVDDQESRVSLLSASTLVGPATIFVAAGLLVPLLILFRYSLNRFEPRRMMVEALTAENYIRFFSDPFYRRPYWKRGAMEQDKQAVYFVSANGKLSRADAGDIKQPNGVIGTPDGKRLYVADIGAGKTYQYEVANDGTLSNRKQFCAQGSDGMTIDDQGHVYFTLGKFVTVYDKTGKKVASIDVPENCTNVCFGGTDMKTLFITAGTSLYSIPMKVKGAARQ